MALIRPYVTDRYTSYKGDEILTLLSIALWLKDDYTKRELVGNVKVMIKEGDKDKEAFKNLSGYYIFTNLENRDYNISIETEFYFPANMIIDPSKIKNLADLNLSFDGNGPAVGSYSAILSNVSELQKNYVLKFCNSEGKIEERSITDIDTGSRTIYWDEALRYEFSEPGSTVGAVSYLIEFILKPRAYYPFPANATLIRGLIRESGDPDKPITDATVKVDSQNLETKSDENGEFVIYFTKTTGIIDDKINFDIIKDGKRSFEAPIEEGKSKSVGIKKFP